MTGTVDAGFVAECYWAGVGPEDLRSLDERVSSCASELTRTGERVRYLGSMLIVEDEVVLCLFEGSATAVRSVAERAAIPFGRILRGTGAPWSKDRSSTTPHRREGGTHETDRGHRALGGARPRARRLQQLVERLRLHVVQSAPPTSTAPAATSAAAETGGLSGTWSGQYDGTFQGTFVLDWQQSGSNLSGTIKLSSGSGTLDINGTVNGDTISFGTVGSQAITYSGSVSGDSMSGTYKVQGQASSAGGSWSATKGS